jgi:CheY-like chemotaxis protein
LSETRLETAVLRSFLNVFNNLLYVLIQNSGDALRQMTSDHVLHRRITEIADTAGQLESATRRLQGLVEGTTGFRGTATILVADDHEPLRSLVVKTLKEHGYTVFAASSGFDALEKCNAYPGPIHLLLADVGMETMDGYELVRRVLQIRPNTKAIYISGNLLDHSRAMPGTEFLLKPNELVASLPKKVWQMLNQP